MGLGVVLVGQKKISPMPPFEHRTIRQGASRYTDYSYSSQPPVRISRTLKFRRINWTEHVARVGIIILVFTVFCIVCTVFCIVCTVFCIVCTVFCIVCTVFCIVCIVFCIVCTVFCFVLFVLCFVLFVLCFVLFVLV